MMKLKLVMIITLILNVFIGSYAFYISNDKQKIETVKSENDPAIINSSKKSDIDFLKEGFVNPPDSARPGVYWYFMDGNMSKESITADLESMKQAGLGHVLFLEVNVGIPRGNVDFFSEKWKDLFVHMVRESERLRISVSLGIGPGWTGSGGPWVAGAESMRHLVYSSIIIDENQKREIVIKKPNPVSPYFGESVFTPELKEKWANYYEDVVVLAFPTPADTFKIRSIMEKAIYYRSPYTSMPGVLPYIPTQVNYIEPKSTANILADKIIDVTKYLKSDSVLDWKAPSGRWTIMRFGARNNGAVTRPAPMPGLGFEVDKFDTLAFKHHLENFTDKLLKRVGIPRKNAGGGLKMLHMDSWEVGAQNWTANLRSEFIKRRGYDPQPYYPVYAGIVVENLEKSERFLWDLRQTCQELVVENHAQYLKNYAHRRNMTLSIEPYDMNPTSDMELGAVADVPMCEFWSAEYGFNSSFSCIQAASIAHIDGKNIVGAEAFTSYLDAWRQYPGSMKNEGDWAFAAGINKFMFHTYQHQSLDDSLKPGMTMGPYGVQHNRNQTWWPMADGYHKYITRCQYILQQGRTVADILYLIPEGAPQVFRAPKTALTQSNELQNALTFTANDEIIPDKSTDDFMPDRKGYNFDGCSPSQLMRAFVKNGNVCFPSGASYKLLVLPNMETMTPRLLKKIKNLVETGAKITGSSPKKSPGLENYPQCDFEVQNTAKLMWGDLNITEKINTISFGKGKIFCGGELSDIEFPDLYPNYNVTSSILRKLGIIEDFVSSEPVRYTHKKIKGLDVYFVSNKSNRQVFANCTFRTANSTVQLWNPMTGEQKELKDVICVGGRTELTIKFEAYESFFVVFSPVEKKQKRSDEQIVTDFHNPVVLSEVNTPWTVEFNPKWGGTASVIFEKLQDWTLRPEEGIKFYSGIATYKNTFRVSESVIKNKSQDVFVDLGEVNNMARVKVNGKDAGVVWTNPYKVKITDKLVSCENTIEIEIANLWVNRLIGDEFKPYDGIKDGQWPDWLKNGHPRTSGRYTFTTFNFYTKDSKLIKSGLVGPVKITLERK